MARATRERRSPCLVENRKRPQSSGRFYSPLSTFCPLAQRDPPTRTGHFRTFSDIFYPEQVTLRGKADRCAGGGGKGDRASDGTRLRGRLFRAAGRTNSVISGTISALFCTNSTFFCTFSAACLGGNRVFALKTRYWEQKMRDRKSVFRPNRTNGKEIDANGAGALWGETGERPIGWAP